MTSDITMGEKIRRGLLWSFYGELMLSTWKNRIPALNKIKMRRGEKSSILGEKKIEPVNLNWDVKNWEKTSSGTPLIHPPPYFREKFLHHNFDQLSSFSDHPPTYRVKSKVLWVVPGVPPQPQHPSSFCIIPLSHACAPGTLGCLQLPSLPSVCSSLGLCKKLLHECVPSFPSSSSG